MAALPDDSKLSRLVDRGRKLIVLSQILQVVCSFYVKISIDTSKFLKGLVPQKQKVSYIP